MNTHIVRTAPLLFAVSLVLMILLIPSVVQGKKGDALKSTTAAAAQGQIFFKLGPDPLWVAAEGRAEMTITINAPQSSETVIFLSTSSPQMIEIPQSVTIPANETSAKFSVAGTAIGAARITATPPAYLNSRVSSAIVSVRPLSVFLGWQYYPLPKPIRLLDTRPGQAACNAPGTALIDNAEYSVAARVTCDGAVIPSNALAVVGNATVVNFISSGGYATIYPSDVTDPTTSNLNYLPNQIIASSFTTGLGVDGAFKVKPSSTIHFIVDITGYYAPPGASNGLYFHPLPRPVRLLDTRPGQSACNAPGLPLNANQPQTLEATGSCESLTIPVGAKALVGNATVVNTSSSSGFITLYQSGLQTPNVSNINYTAGQIIPNAFTVNLGPDGAFNILATSSTHFIVDVAGYYSDQPAADANGVVGHLFRALPRPVRLLDTRGLTTCTPASGPLQANVGIIQNTWVNCESIPIPPDAQVAVGNATVVNFLSAGGFVTLWPNGTTLPHVSNLNFLANQIIPNAFTVGLSPNGQFNIVSTGDTNLIVDMMGYFQK